MVEKIPKQGEDGTEYGKEYAWYSFRGQPMHIHAAVPWFW